MIVVRILGGLGNQMFQYAYAKALEQRDYSVKLDITPFKKYKLHGGYHLDQFHIDLPAASSFELIRAKSNVFRTFKEKSLLFNESFLQLPKSGYVKGYFQTERYFESIRSTLLNQFRLKPTLSPKAKDFEKEIQSTTNSCSLHIRRGDYISNSSAQVVHGSASLDYYQKAVDHIQQVDSNVQFFIFSDDIAWVKENLKINNQTYVEVNGLPHEDMYLMSLCSHNITANSSFSWWGAWLNQNDEKVVISPNQWFVSKENEVACKSWIKL